MMVTTGKYLWIALFVTLQITVGICRSTEKPLNEDKGSTDSVKISDGSTSSNAVQNADVIPREMSYDDDDVDTNVDQMLSGIEIFFIIIAALATVSLIIGFFVYFCKRKSRLGYVLINNSGRPPSAMQQPMNFVHGGYGNAQSIPDIPPPYEQTQDWNTYQPAYAPKY